MLKKVSFLLMGVGLVGLISSCVLPLSIGKKAESEYDIYYNQIKSEVECNKIETKAVCSEATEKINISKGTSKIEYSFYREDTNVSVWEAYYDKNQEYKIGGTYDCIYYEFYCKDAQKRFNCLVIGDGTTSNKDEVFSFEKTANECVKKFTEYRISNVSEEFSKKIGVLFPISLLLLLVAGVIGLIAFEVCIDCDRKSNILDDSSLLSSASN